jgi:hypothetical protein
VAGMCVTIRLHIISADTADTVTDAVSARIVHEDNNHDNNQKHGVERNRLLLLNCIITGRANEERRLKKLNES